MKVCYFVCDACQIKASAMKSFNIKGHWLHYCEACIAGMPGSSRGEQLADNQQVVGSNPTPATTEMIK